MGRAIHLAIRATSNITKKNLGTYKILETFVA